MTIIYFVFTFVVGYLVGYLLRRPPQAQFIEPKDEDYYLITPKGQESGTQFIESVSPKEKWNNAKKITDLTNE